VPAIFELEVKMKKKILFLAILAAIAVSAFINPVFGILAAGIAAAALSVFALYVTMEAMQIATHPVSMW